MERRKLGIKLEHEDDVCCKGLRSWDPSSHNAVGETIQNIIHLDQQNISCLKLPFYPYSSNLKL